MCVIPVAVSPEPVGYKTGALNKSIQALTYI